MKQMNQATNLCSLMLLIAAAAALAVVIPAKQLLWLPNITSGTNANRTDLSRSVSVGSSSIGQPLDEENGALIRPGGTHSESVARFLTALCGGRFRKECEYADRFVQEARPLTKTFSFTTGERGYPNSRTHGRRYNPRDRNERTVLSV